MELIRLIRQMGKKRFLTIALIAFLLLALPATIYLALTKQLIFKRAAFGEVTVNLVPTQVSKNVGEEFPVEIHLNSGQLPISAATLTFNFDPATIPLFGSGTPPQGIRPETGEGKPFTEFYYDAQTALSTFTLLAKKPTEQLPKGTFKVATLTFKGVKAGSGTISLDLSKTQIIGANEQNEDVSLTVKEGTKVSYTISGGKLCPTASCPTNITLKEESREDGRFNIRVSWTHPQSQPPTAAFKIYRNIGAPVPADHPAANLAGTSQVTSFLDTNNSQGFAPKAEVHYDVDAYNPCSIAELNIQGEPSAVISPLPPASPAGKKEIVSGKTTLYVGTAETVKLIIDGADLPPELRQKEIVLLMDRSGSMGRSWDSQPSSDESPEEEAQENTPSSGPKKIDKAKEVLNKFVDLSNAQTEKLALASYAKTASLDVPLTFDYPKVKTGINRLSPKGGTSIGSGLKVAVAELIKEKNEKIKEYVVLASDGLQKAAPSVYDQGILQSAIDHKIIVYTVGIGNDVKSGLSCPSCPSGINTGEKYLQDIAQKTGGKYYFAETPETLVQVYEAIRGEIGKLEVEVLDHLTSPYFADISLSKVTDGEEKEVVHQLVASDFAVKGGLGLLGENEKRNIYLQAKIAAGQGGGPWQATVDNEAEPNKIIYKNPADKSVVYEKDFENKTVTISSGVCQQDAKIILPEALKEVNLKFKIKFQGVNFANLREEDKVQKVKLTVIKQIYQGVGTQTGEPTTIMSKEFANIEVKPEKVGTDPIAVWNGQVTLTGVPADSGYSILTKGPKHLQRKFCQDKPTERAEEGYPYQCKGPGKIALTAGEMELDFSGVLLQGGDLPGPQGQDGVVNALDVSLIINILKDGQSRKEEDLKMADIDLNGVVNFLDRSALIETLEEKYGDEE